MGVAVRSGAEVGVPVHWIAAQRASRATAGGYRRDRFAKPRQLAPRAVAAESRRIIRVGALVVSDDDERLRVLVETKAQATNLELKGGGSVKRTNRGFGW